jgi:hypothetical protein
MSDSHGYAQRPPVGRGSRARLKRDALRVVPDDWRERVFDPGEAQMISEYSGIPVEKVQTLASIAVLKITGRWRSAWLPVSLKDRPHVG